MSLIATVGPLGQSAIIICFNHRLFYLLSCCICLVHSNVSVKSACTYVFLFFLICFGIHTLLICYNMNKQQLRCNVLTPSPKFCSEPHLLCIFCSFFLFGAVMATRGAHNLEHKTQNSLTFKRLILDADCMRTLSLCRTHG